MPCFHWLFTRRQMSIRTAEVRPFFFLCLGRGTSVARRDHGGGLALSESSQDYCRSWYDAEITRNRQWRQRITEDLPDASKMYDWKFTKRKCLSLLFEKVETGCRRVGKRKTQGQWDRKHKLAKVAYIDLHLLITLCLYSRPHLALLLVHSPNQGWWLTQLLHWLMCEPNWQNKSDWHTVWRRYPYI